MIVMGRPKGSKNKTKHSKFVPIKKVIIEKPVDINLSVDPLIDHVEDKTFRNVEIRRDACEYLVGVVDIYSGFFEFDCNGTQCHNETDWCPIRDTKPWYTPKIHPTKQVFGAKK